MKNCKNSVSLRDRLYAVKSLWEKDKSLKHVQDIMWEFQHKLPVEYEKSIIAYCSSKPGHANSNSLLLAAEKFKCLTGSYENDHALVELSSLMNQQIAFSKEQTNVLLFNLANLHFLQGHFHRGKKMLESIKSFGPQLAPMYLQVWVSSNATIKQAKKAAISPIIVNSLSRFIAITNPDSFSAEINKSKSCSVVELYNIGICLKKVKKFKQAAEIFNKAAEQFSQQLRKSVLCKVNQAECYFFIGHIGKAINLLKQLTVTVNPFAECYQLELNAKINYWSKSNQILDIISSNAKTNEKKPKGKALHQKNKKLVQIQELQQQLERLLDSGQSKCEANYPHSQKMKVPLCAYEMKTKVKRQKLQNPKFKDSNNSKALISHKKNMKKIMTLFSENSSEASSISANESESESSESESEESNSSLVFNYNDILRGDSDDAAKAEACCKLAQIYIEKRQYHEAKLLLKQALTKGCNKTLVRLGEIDIIKCNYRSAIQNFEKYLELVDPSNRTVELKLIHCYSKQSSSLNKAICRVKVMLANDPSDWEAHTLLISLLLKQNNFEKAIAYCEEYKRDYALNFDNIHMLGLLYQEANKHKQAYDSFLCALKINPYHVPSLIEIASQVHSEYFYKDLLQIYRKGLFQNEFNFKVLQILRKLVEQKNLNNLDLKDTLSFRELIDVGDFFLGEEMIDEAEYAYKLASKFAVNSLVMEKLGDVLYFKKNYEEAEKFYEKCQWRKSLNSIQFKIGNIKLKKNEYHSAINVFTSCYNKGLVSKGIYLHMLGQCEYGLKNYSQASQHFKDSIALNYSKKANDIWIAQCQSKIKEETAQ